MPEFPKPDAKPKKQPKPLKRTPLKKKPYTLRKFTPKRAKLEKQKLAMYESEAQERQPFCRGCGTTQNLNHSHRISQNDRTQIANPKNVDFSAKASAISTMRLAECGCSTTVTTFLNGLLKPIGNAMPQRFSK